LLARHTHPDTFRALPRPSTTSQPLQIDGAAPVDMQKNEYNYDLRSKGGQTDGPLLLRRCVRILPTAHPEFGRLCTRASAER
jgi:hypothetical protein